MASQRRTEQQDVVLLEGLHTYSKTYPFDLNLPAAVIAGAYPAAEAEDAIQKAFECYSLLVELCVKMNFEKGDILNLIYHHLL